MSDKVISYVPSENGRLYEIRSNGVGTFIAQTRKATAFQKVRAGFIPALPKIPFSVLSEILAFLSRPRKTSAFLSATSGMVQNAEMTAHLLDITLLKELATIKCRKY
jgi:hypothetical protein